MGATVNRRYGAASIAIAIASAVAATTVGGACSTVLEAGGAGVDGGGGADGSSSDGPSGDGPFIPAAPCTADASPVCSLGGSGSVAPEYISAHGSYVYFADTGGKLRKVPKAGGATEPVFPVSPVPTCLSSSASGLYWCSGPVIQRAVPIEAPTTISSTPQTTGPTRVRTRTNFVAWTARSPDAVYTSNGDFTGGGPIETTALAPAAIAVDRAFVYFAESGSTGRMMRRTHAGNTPLVVGVAADGGAPQTADKFDGVTAIAAGASQIVWVDTKGVYRKLTTTDAAFADGPADRLNITIKDGIDVLIDDAGGTAYVLTSGGRLHVLPLDGGLVEEITAVRAACSAGRGMAHEDDPEGPADAYLYLACDSSILRVKKVIRR